MTAAARSRATKSARILGLTGLLWLQVALGDEVVMTNGDRLTGRVLQDTQETVLLETAYLGIVEIDRSGVRSIKREPVPTATVAEEPTEAEPDAVTDAAQPGDLQASAAGPERRESRPPKAGSAQASVFTPDSQFSGRVNFALSDEKGNNDKSEIDVDYHLEYRQGWHRFRSLGVLEFDTNDSEKTTDKWSTLNQYSRLFPSRWYGAAWLAFEHNRFSDLRLRTLGGPALGYLAVEGDALNLAIEAGPTLLREDFYDQPDQDFSGLGWFLRYDQLVWQERLQPYHRQFGYLSLDGKDKVLWQSWTGIRVPLASGLTASIEFEYDYDNSPAIQAKTTDTTLRLKLGYAW